MAERPGIMFYFDLAPALSMLSNDEAGQLFKAAMEYGQNGVVPELGGMAEIAWAFIRPKIDRDNEQYEKAVIDKQYAAYCSHLKNGEDRLSRDEWYSTVYLHLQAPAGTCLQTLPTTTGTTTATGTGTTTATGTGTGTTTGTTTGTGTGAAAPTGEGTGKGVRGETQGDPERRRQEAIEKLERYGRDG